MRSRLVPSRLAEAALGHDRHHVEVRPPEREREHQAEQRRGDRARRRARRASPVPIATIDSPSAMITISEKRSAKWPGETRKPRTPNTNGPAKSIDSATIQTRVWAAPSRNAATISSAGAGSAVRASPDRLAGVDVVVRLGEDEDVEPAGGRVGEREHERVVAERLRDRERRDQERRPSRRASGAARGPPRRPRSWSARRTPPTPTRAPRGSACPVPSPLQLGSAAIRAVTWVIAKTKTRSKNSSSGATRFSSAVSMGGRTLHQVPDGLAETGSVRTRATHRDGALRRGSLPGLRDYATGERRPPRSRSSRPG